MEEGDFLKVPPLTCIFGILWYTFGSWKELQQYGTMLNYYFQVAKDAIVDNVYLGLRIYTSGFTF